MTRTVGARVLVVGAIVCLLATASEAQPANPARTFKAGPVSVTVFDGTGDFHAQSTIRLFGGNAVEVLSIPVDVTVPPSRRNLLIVEFVGHFLLPTQPITVAVDCTVDHQINTAYSCGLTPAADFDFRVTPPSGAPNAVVPATFLIRDVPAGTHHIGIAVEVASPTGASALFATGSSSLVVSLYADKEK